MVTMLHMTRSASVKIMTYYVQYILLLGDTCFCTDH